MSGGARPIDAGTSAGGMAENMAIKAASQQIPGMAAGMNAATMPTWQKGLMGALTGDKLYGKNAPLIHGLMQKSMQGMMKAGAPHPLAQAAAAPLGAPVSLMSTPGAPNIFGSPGAPAPISTAPGGVGPAMQRVGMNMGPQIASNFRGF